MQQIWDKRIISFNQKKWDSLPIQTNLSTFAILSVDFRVLQGTMKQTAKLKSNIQDLELPLYIKKPTS